MFVLTKISNSIYRIATKKFAILFMTLFVAIIVYMESCPYGIKALKDISNGAGMLDMMIGYSLTDVYSLFDLIGTSGRSLYSSLLGLDFIFALIFMLFQSVLLSVLLRKVDTKPAFKRLNLLPFLRSGLDLLENCLLLFLLFHYPEHYPVVVVFSSIVTTAKWIIYAAIIVTAFSLGTILSIKRLKVNRKKTLIYVK